MHADSLLTSTEHAHAKLVLIKEAREQLRNYVPNACEFSDEVSAFLLDDVSVLLIAPDRMQQLQRVSALVGPPRPELIPSAQVAKDLARAITSYAEANAQITRELSLHTHVARARVTELTDMVTSALAMLASSHGLLELLNLILDSIAGDGPWTIGFFRLDQLTLNCEGKAGLRTLHGQLCTMSPALREAYDEWTRELVAIVR
jgi:hypothetical protein